MKKQKTHKSVPCTRLSTNHAQDTDHKDIYCSVLRVWLGRNWFGSPVACVKAVAGCEKTERRLSILYECADLDLVGTDAWQQPGPQLVCLVVQLRHETHTIPAQ